MDTKLLEILVCPLCKGPLVAGPAVEGRLTELQCRVDRLAEAHGQVATAWLRT